MWWHDDSLPVGPRETREFQVIQLEPGSLVVTDKYGNVMPFNPSSPPFAPGGMVMDVRPGGRASVATSGIFRAGPNETFTFTSSFKTRY